MPNIKSAIKRVDVIEKKTLRNNMIKSEYKTAVKKIDGACSKGIIKKNTASRKKSNLAKKLNTLA